MSVFQIVRPVGALGHAGRRWVALGGVRGQADSRSRSRWLTTWVTPSPRIDTP
jgi:hypothetical protein